MRIRRIVAGFDPGEQRREALRDIAGIARELQAELLGLFVEDIELLRAAALPFVREVCAATAAERPLDAAALERLMQRRAAELRAALGAAASGLQSPWSFRTARGSLAGALAAAIAEGEAPALLIPPGADPRGERRIVTVTELTEARLRVLLASSRPMLVMPDGRD